jgi:hypothetical protein
MQSEHMFAIVECMFSPTHALLDELTLGDKSRPELRCLLGDLHRLEAHAAERRLAVMAELNALDDGGLDAASEARTVIHRSARGAKRDAATAGALAKLPAAADALASGQITVEHAERLADAVHETSPEEATELVTMAEQIPADLFAKRTNRWLGARRDRHAVEDRHARQRAEREFSAWNEGGDSGSLLLHGQMDNATGRAFMAALQAKVDELWRSDGGRDGSPDEVRSPAQRRLDALVEFVTGEQSSGDLRHVKHLVHLVVTAETGDAEFIDGEPVPTAFLAHLDSHTTQIVGHVFDGEGRPLWLGRRRRLASVDQWLHLIVRDRGCTDCGADPAHSEAHHLTEWSNHGPSDVDNLELKCHTDHGLAHHKGNRAHGDTRRHRAA